MNLRLTFLATTLAALVAAPAMASGPFMAEHSAEVAPQESANLLAGLNAQRASNGLDENHGFAIARQHPGVIGTKISRLNHTFKDVRIYGSESVIVTNDVGSVISESVADRRQGLAQLGSSLRSGSGSDFSVAPKLSGKEVIAQVVNAVAPNGTHDYPPKAELVVYPVLKSVRVASARNKAEADLNAFDVEDVLQGYELAYVVETRMKNNGNLVFVDSIVSANDGRVFKQWDAKQTVTGTGKSQYSGTVSINTKLSGTTYQMIDTARGIGGVFGGMAITNLKNTGITPGTIYTDVDNAWGDGLNYSGAGTTTANGQTAAVDSMWGLKNTYDMLSNVLGWKSLDGKNTASYIGVHHNSAEDNAYYDPACKCMKIGDGGTMFKTLASLDVIGHEMSHGVTGATSNLTYSGESGGLNEAASDMGGEMVESYAKAGGIGSVIPATGNDWMIGKEVSKSTSPLRWMYKPSKDGRSPDAWSSTLGSLNVHYSSGPGNRMFYFLAKGSSSTTTSEYYSKYLTKAPLAMVGIGNDKAYRIWFRALTTKFTSSTNYASAQTKCVTAATELYGAASKEVNAVKRAFAAINVGVDIAGI